MRLSAVDWWDSGVTSSAMATGWGVGGRERVLLVSGEAVMKERTTRRSRWTTRKSRSVLHIASETREKLG